jgi:hypothetical protein
VYIAANMCGALSGIITGQDKISLVILTVSSLIVLGGIVQTVRELREPHPRVPVVVAGIGASIAIALAWAFLVFSCIGPPATVSTP